MIFDLDGTLAETWPICFEAFRNTFIKFTGRRYSDEEIEAMYGPDEEGIIKKVVIDDWKAGVETYLEEYERAHYLCEAPFPGILDALQMLQDRKIPLALVTGKGIGSTIISLKHLGLEKFFDIIVPGHPEGGRKWESIKKVLAQWEVSSNKVAYLGDAATDVDAARKAGVIPLGAAWSKHADYDKISSRSPFAIFRTVQDFTNFIREGIP
jgi:pyrophosphatase PpaX